MAVVVAYGPPQHLAACLAALGSTRVVVVDNGQSADTQAVCAEAGVAYHATDVNRGFAGGVNVGLAQVDPHLDVLLLNPDARIGWPDVLRLQAVLRSDPTLAAVAPQLTHPDGSAQRTAWPFPTPLTVWLDAVGLGDTHHGPTFVTGAVLLLRAEARAEVGGFDERYFLYAEETDWQRRALGRDWRVRLVRDVGAVHVGGASSESADERVRRSVRSSLAYARRWHPGAGAAVMRAGAVVAAVRRGVTADPRRRHEQAVMLRTLLSASS
jgi:GT2 family glycosyltransferase